MKIKGKSNNKGYLFIVLLVVIFLLFFGRGLMLTNEVEKNVELDKSTIEKKTHLDDKKNLIDLIDDKSSLIISKKDVDIHVVEEFGRLKLVYIYKKELEGRQKTDRFFIHVYIKESSELFKPEGSNYMNFDFVYYKPLKLKKDGKKYYVFTKSLAKNDESALKIKDIKSINTGRFLVGMGPSESYTSTDFSNLKVTPLNNNNLKTYCLYTKDKSYKKLSKKREEAIINGILLTADDDLVNGKISDCEGEQLGMEFRLKGDWVDHLVHPNKWSFRVIMDNGQTFQGMRKFSFQHPKSRNYLWEWLFHRVIKKEGLIGLRYDFCNLMLNVQEEDALKTESLGIMALEESFDKILIENNKLREGVIIAFDESYLWNKREQQKRFGVTGGGELILLEKAPIKVFNQNKVLSDPKLSKQFAIAKGLLDGLRKKKYKISDVFDLEKLTTFTALSNLFGAHHGLRSHNIRVYYNPITNKLEPIAFDALAGDRQDQIFNYPFAENDKEYNRLLLEKLTLFSNEEFIRTLLDENSDELESLILSLSSEFKSPSFDPEVLSYNSNFIKSEINPADIIIASLVERSSDSIIIQIDNLTNHDVQLNSLKHVDGKRLDLGMNNSLIMAKQSSMVKVELNPFFVNAFVSKKNKNGQFRFPKDVEKLVLNHEIVGVGYNRKAQIIPYISSSKPEEKVMSYHELFKSNISEFEFAQVYSDSIVFKRGKYSTNKSIIIPVGVRLFIEEGFELNLLNESSLFCFASVNFTGSKENPIKFHSTDSTGRGLFITDANKKSTLNYCDFNNLSNPQLNEWVLSGAVNFHESDVDISNSIFTNNRCEDYLNIIRSEFTLSNSSIQNSMSDAFDGDFVTGEILNCQFINCGNDGIDVSGSQLKLKDILVDNPSDKAISAGEASVITGSDIEVKAGEIGIVCKDLSVIELSNIEVIDTRLVAAVFQKKPEYGAGEIHLENILFTNNEEDYLIEVGSVLEIDKIALETNSDNVNDQMYGREYGKSSK